MIHTIVIAYHNILNILCYTNGSVKIVEEKLDFC
jgi:hypothetical protein